MQTLTSDSRMFRYFSADALTFDDSVGLRIVSRNAYVPDAELASRAHDIRAHNLMWLKIWPDEESNLAYTVPGALPLGAQPTHAQCMNSIFQYSP